jgi:hypothetical protein
VSYVFILQKRASRIILKYGSRESCRYLFEKLEIITFYSQLIYSLILFTINNNYLFNSINEILKYKTRSLNNFYLSSISLTKYSKGAYVAGIKAFNDLPQV